MPMLSTSSFTWPPACAASVWNSAPFARAIPETLAKSVTVPTSLLAAMTETSAVSSVTASSSRPASTCPCSSAGTYVTLFPSPSRARAVSRTASCSAEHVTRWSPLSACRRIAPRMARLSDSVAPLVNTISRGRAPTSEATAALASSTAEAASAP